LSEASADWDAGGQYEDAAHSLPRDGPRPVARLLHEATLNLPGDGEVATLELVHDAGTDFKLGTGFSHIVVQVDDLVATLSELASKRVSVEEPQHPAGESGPKTSWVLDPDGYRIELVEWPPGHPDGVTRADFA
jgi:lactoylglutathione lyase